MKCFDVLHDIVAIGTMKNVTIYQNGEYSTTIETAGVMLPLTTAINIKLAEVLYLNLARVCSQYMILVVVTVMNEVLFFKVNGYFGFSFITLLG